MPLAALQECRYPRCPNYANDRGYCSAHDSNARRQEYGNLTTHNSRFRWMRAAFLMRHPVCAGCHTEPATVLDHVVPHRGNAALYWSQSNWQGLCVGCHAVKTAGEMGRGAGIAAATLTVLMGAPGAGKSTWARQFPKVISTDMLRMHPERTDEVFRGAFADIAALLRQGSNVVLDTTAEHPAIRRRAIETARHCRARVALVVFTTPVDTCCARQADRHDPVPVDVVRRVHASIVEQLEGPESEGWDTITLVPAAAVPVLQLAGVGGGGEN